MDDSKRNEESYPRISGDEFVRNTSEIMRLAERSGGVYLTDEKGEDSAFIWIPMDELPPSYEY